VLSHGWMEGLCGAASGRGGRVSSSMLRESEFEKVLGQGLVVSVLPSLPIPVAPSAGEKPVTPSDPVAVAPPTRPLHRA
jgi:hypothetical protein